MSALDFSKPTISAAGDALRAGSVSSRELTEAFLARIDALNPRINAYLSVTAERARADADRADAERARGIDRGPLHGIPIAHKDLYETAGIRTTGGAKIHADHLPASDGTVVRKLREAGTVLLGKLNTHEYAYGVSTNNPHFGPTRNPWNTERIPAGSSGGSGAAIAAGLAVATTGTDTGGSIRLPAAACGVVGLKPTYGRVSKAGILPLSYRYDHAGPLTRTVLDAALMLNAMAGYDPTDATTIRIPSEDFTVQRDGGVRGLRIGVLRGWFFEQLEDGVADVMEAALGEFIRQGAMLHEINLDGTAEAIAALFDFVRVEAQEIHASALRSRAEDFGADLRAILQSPPPDAAQLAHGMRAVDAWTVACRTAFEAVDVLVAPTSPITAPLIGEETVRFGDVEQPVLVAMVRCTGPFNASHLPALSVPCGFTAAGMPVGLQIIGRPFDEALLVRVGHAYEQGTGWHLCTPAL